MQSPRVHTDSAALSGFQADSVGLAGRSAE